MIGSGLRFKRLEADCPDWLARAAASLSEARYLQEVLAAALDQATGFLGPVGGILGLLDASRLAVVIAGAVNTPASMLRGNKVVRLTANLPMADALRSGRSIWVSGAVDRSRRYPEVAARVPGRYACASMPLAAAGGPFGVLYLTRASEDGQEAPFDATERAFAELLADLVAVAIWRLTAGRPEDQGQATGEHDAGVYEWDLGDDHLYVNAAMLRLHGHGPSTGPGLRQRVRADRFPEFGAALRAVGARHEGYVLHYEAPANPGPPRKLRARGQLVGLPHVGGFRAVGTVIPVPAGPRTRLAAAPLPLADVLTNELSATLAAAATLAEFGGAATTAMRVLGAEGMVLADRQADRVRILVLAGFTATERQLVRAGPMTTRKKTADTLDLRAPLYARSTAELRVCTRHFRPVLDAVYDHAWAVLPLASDYDAPGACLLAFPPGWSPTAREQGQLLMAGGLLARVLDRCRTHDQEHRVVTEIQRDLSGGPLADLPGLALAGRYRPGNFGVGLGGDFYDAFTQPDGKLAMFVGDVQGHDTRAGVTASRLRTALRAYALEGHDPEQIVGCANRVLADLNGDADDAVFATCCYATFDPARGRLVLSRAGHPHPVVVTDGEPARALIAAGGLPLGIDSAHCYPATVFTVSPRSTLLLYTDGLIERPGSDIEAGIRDLLRELDDIHSPAPATTLAGLSSLNSSVGRFDDIAVLAARYG